MRFFLSDDVTLAPVVPCTRQKHASTWRGASPWLQSAYCLLQQLIVSCKTGLACCRHAAVLVIFAVVCRGCWPRPPAGDPFCRVSNAVCLAGSSWSPPGANQGADPEHSETTVEQSLWASCLHAPATSDVCAACAHYILPSLAPGPSRRLSIHVAP